MKRNSGPRRNIIGSMPGPYHYKRLAGRVRNRVTAPLLDERDKNRNGLRGDRQALIGITGIRRQGGENQHSWIGYWTCTSMK